MIVVLSVSILLPLQFDGTVLMQVRLLCAVVPALVILDFFIRSDLFPEPPHLILTTFVLGIVVTLPGVAEVPSDIASQPPIGRRSDGSACRHEGETSTYCTLCWTNIKPSTILSR